MIFTYSNLLEFSLQICLMSLKQFFRNVNVAEDFINLGCFSISLKTLPLNAMVLLWIFNFPTICINFSFSLKHLKTFPSRNAIDIMPFLFMRRICSNSFIISAATSGFFTLSAHLFSSSISTTLSIVMDSVSCFLISSLLRRFFFLLFSEFSHS